MERHKGFWQRRDALVTAQLFKGSGKTGGQRAGSAPGHPSLAGQGSWVNWIPAALQPHAQALGCLSSPLSLFFQGVWLTSLPWGCLSAWCWRCQPEHRATRPSCKGSSVTSPAAWSFLRQLSYFTAQEYVSIAFQHPKEAARQYFFLNPCPQQPWEPLLQNFFAVWRRNEPQISVLHASLSVSPL